jgi:outer membrane protein, heavy metal efflux system
MTPARAVPVILVSCALAGCASVPRDSGFADVRAAVLAETQQPVAWDPTRPIQPPDDGDLVALLQEPLTVDRAVQIAFAHNRDLQATLEGLGLARAHLMQASTIRNPVVHGEIRLPGDPRRPFEIGISQTLVDLWRLGSRKKQGRAEFAAAQLRISGAVIQFAGQVRADYYGLLAARKILAGHETLLKAQAAATELAVRQHAAGNISDLDLEKEQSRYEEVKLQHARAQLDEAVERERLLTALGLVHRRDLTLLPDFPPAPETEPHAEEVEQQVAARRLDLRLAQREVEAAQHALGVARTAVLEDVEIGGHLEREPDGKQTTGPSLEVPLPIFDRGKARKSGALALMRQAQQRLAALTVTARSEGRTALSRLQEARARMTYMREVVVPRRQRILKLTQIEYNAMLSSVYQLIEARQELARAERDEVLATRDYWLARTELEAAISGVSSFSLKVSR